MNGRGRRYFEDFAKKTAKLTPHFIEIRNFVPTFCPPRAVNPDDIPIINSQNSTTMAYVISDDCIACGTCLDNCPSGAISEGEKYSINPDICVDCGTCADVCPSGAISPGE